MFPTSAHCITRHTVHTPLVALGNVRHAHLPGAIEVQRAPLPPEAGEPTHRVRMTSRPADQSVLPPPGSLRLHRWAWTYHMHSLSPQSPALFPPTGHGRQHLRVTSR